MLPWSKAWASENSPALVSKGVGQQSPYQQTKKGIFPSAKTLSLGGWTGSHRERVLAEGKIHYTQQAVSCVHPSNIY